YSRLGATWVSTTRSPAGPPRSPAWPWPRFRILVPVLTPGGIVTCSVRRTWRTPAPPHVSHGSSTTVPAPPHVGQGWLMTSKPPRLRPTTPRPRHSGQSRGEVPGFAPLPLQVGQASATSIATWTLAPSIACSNDRLTD